MKIGITGHQLLSSQDWVRGKINEILNGLEDPIIGVTSLAVGADQLFAEAVIAHGGTIKVIIPIQGYSSTFEARDRIDYFKLLKFASETETIEKKSSNNEAYLAAGKRVVDSSEIMIAVWDGKPAKGLGGTGDIVKYALSKNKKVFHINPEDKTSAILK